MAPRFKVHTDGGRLDVSLTHPPEGTPTGFVTSHITGEGPDDGAWRARFLHAPAIGIAGGSNEVQRNIIGERVLGLPCEAAVDDVPFRQLVATRR